MLLLIYMFNNIYKRLNTVAEVKLVDIFLNGCCGYAAYGCVDNTKGDTTEINLANKYAKALVNDLWQNTQQLNKRRHTWQQEQE